MKIKKVFPRVVEVGSKIKIGGRFETVTKIEIGIGRFTGSKFWKFFYTIYAENDSSEIFFGKTRNSQSEKIEVLISEKKF